MQVIPLTGKAWVLDWDLEELESVLVSVQTDNWRKAIVVHMVTPSVSLHPVEKL